MVESLHPDIVLIEASSLTQGLRLLTEVHAKSPETKILIADRRSSERYLTEALSYGARGFISKTAQDSAYLKALRAIQAGDIWVERKVLAHVIEDLLRKGSNLPQTLLGSWKGLTPREQEIMTLIAQGMTNKEMAKELGISDKTIKAHLSRIFAN